MSLYSLSKTISLELLLKVPTACSLKSPLSSCSGFDDGFEVCFVGYKGCFIPASSTQLILV